MAEETTTTELISETMHARLRKIIKVSHAEPMMMKASRTVTFQPDELRLTYTNGQYGLEITVHGPRILRGGGYGQRVSRDWYVNDPNMPDWLRLAVETFRPKWEEVKINGSD